MMEEDKVVFVIIGGGIAGVSCAEALSIWNQDDSVLLLTASPIVKVAENVVQLTKTLTQFEVVERDASSLNERYNNVRVRHCTVVGFDPVSRTVHTDNGNVISYERLCICSGGRPKLIEEDNPYVIGIRDTDSAAELSRRVACARRILIVGNGGIATEIVYEIEGVEKIWVMKDDHISSTFVDAGASQFFQKCMNKKQDESRISKRTKYTVTSSNTGGPALGPDWHSGIELKGKVTDKLTIEYECHVAEIILLKNEEWPVRVVLSNGNSYECDFVVSATGVIPNGASFETGSRKLQFSSDGGISVDWKMETNLDGVYAAGDVCTAAWDIAPQWHQMRLWTQARQMGMYAAQSMSSSLSHQPLLQDFCFELFSHVTKFFGFKVVLLGLFNGQKLNGEYEVLLRMTHGQEYIKLITKGGKLQGALLIGDTDLEEMCENLILNQLDLTPYGEDLLNPDIDIEDYFD